MDQGHKGPPGAAGLMCWWNWVGQVWGRPRTDEDMAVREARETSEEYIWGQKSDLKGKNSLQQPAGGSSGDCVGRCRQFRGLNRKSAATSPGAG